MYFSPALVTILTLGVARSAAAPLRTPFAAADAALAARFHSGLAARDHGASSMAMHRRAQVMEQAAAVVARHASLPRSEERTRLVVRDLERRGLLDQLVIALRDILTTLLGQNPPGSKSRRSSPEETEALLTQISCLLAQLMGQEVDASMCTFVATTSAGSKNGTASAAADKNATASTSSSSNSAPLPADSASRKAKAEKADKSDKAAQKDNAEHDQDSKPTAAAATQKQREQIRDIILARQAPSGVTGLLTVLRDLVDAILNTLLPMSSRSDEASSTQQMNSTSSPDDGECPPPGTMNDGMYRPNCPGYGGRRDIAERDMMSDLMTTLLPMIMQIMAALSSTESATAAAATSSAAPAKQANAASTSTDPIGDLLSGLYTGSSDDTAAAAAPTAEKANKKNDTEDAPGGSASAVDSAAKLAVRELLGADGLELVERGEVMARRAGGILGELLVDGDLLSRRADFSPVWAEVKKLGNGEWTRRDVHDDFAPVWQSFSAMVDEALGQASPAKRSNGSKASDFARAAMRFGAKTFFRGGSNLRRSTDAHGKRAEHDWQPLLSAAGDFAKTQMSEWTTALNEHAQRKA